MTPKTAVIIHGNPKFVEGKDKTLADAFYAELQRLLEKHGYEVSHDPGKPYTAPKKATIWIGHSRGADRLRFAPPDTKKIAIGTPDPDPDWIYISHPKDEKRLALGLTPNKYHYMLTSKMRAVLVTAITEKTTIREVRKIIAEAMIRPPPNVLEEVTNWYLQQYASMAYYFLKQYRDFYPTTLEFLRTFEPETSGRPSSVSQWVKNGDGKKSAGVAQMALRINPEEWSPRFKDLRPLNLTFFMDVHENPQRSGMFDPAEHYPSLTIEIFNDHIAGLVQSGDDQYALNIVQKNVDMIRDTVAHEMIHFIQYLYARLANQRASQTGRAKDPEKIMTGNPGKRRTGGNFPKQSDVARPWHLEYFKGYEFQTYLHDAAQEYRRRYPRFTITSFRRFVGAPQKFSSSASAMSHMRRTIDGDYVNEFFLLLKKHDPKKWRYAVSLLYHELTKEPT
jgi:hypothetical protein